MQHAFTCPRTLIQTGFLPWFLLYLAKLLCTDWLTCDILGMPLSWDVPWPYLFRGAESVSDSSWFPSLRHAHLIELNQLQISAHFISPLGIFFSPMSHLQPCLPQPCCILWLVSYFLSFKNLLIHQLLVKPHLTLSSHLPSLQAVGEKQPGCSRLCLQTPAQVLSTCLREWIFINFISKTLHFV